MAPERADGAGGALPRRAGASGADAVALVLHARRQVAHRVPPEDEPRARHHARAPAYAGVALARRAAPARARTVRRGGARLAEARSAPTGPDRLRTRRRSHRGP